MEFLRFGSSIPGTYWGCCAADIIQNFNVSPDDKSSIQIVNGDQGIPVLKNQKSQFAGPTYRDIFLQRLRYGTFSTTDMPNHAFFAILTRNQLNTANGKAWLAILKENGFEFIRTVVNSVYSGNNLLESEPAAASEAKVCDCSDPDDCCCDDDDEGGYENYVFALFRNIGEGAIRDPFTPPKEWTDLPSVVPEAWEYIVAGASNTLPQLATAQRAAQRAIWDKIGPAKFMTEEEVVAAGAPVMLAGLRSDNPQEEKSFREGKKAAAGKKVETSLKGCVHPGNAIVLKA